MSWQCGYKWCNKLVGWCKTLSFKGARVNIDPRNKTEAFNTHEVTSKHFLHLQVASNSAALKAFSWRHQDKISCNKKGHNATHILAATRIVEVKVMLDVKNRHLK